MNDKTCRLEILRQLKETFDKDPDVDLEKPDLRDALKVETNVLERNVRYLEEKGLIRVDYYGGGHFSSRITSEGIDFLETGQPSGLAILNPVTIHQEFNAPVGAVSGRDIYVQISFSEVLNQLADTVTSDQKIPKEEKQSLVERLKSLAQNEWIRSTGTSVLADLIKKSVGI